MIPTNITRSKVAETTAKLLGKFATNIPDPNRLSASLGDRDITLQNVKDDGHVSSCIQSRKAGVLSLEFEITYDDTNKQYKDIFDSILKDIDVYSCIGDFLEAPLFGFSVSEINWIYKKFNEQTFLVPGSLNQLPRSWFTFDNRKILHLNDLSNTVLPLYKFLLVQNNASYDNPYGESLLSRCLWPVVFKKANFTYWIMFAEIHGIPKPVGSTDSQNGSDDWNNFYEALENFIRDGILVKSKEDDVEIINSVNQANSDLYDRFIERNNIEISKILLSETLTTEIGSNGSYAASMTHFDVKKEIRNSDKRLVEKAFNSLFKWVTYFNFPEINPPKFTMYEAQDVDKPLAEVVDLLTRNNQVRFLAPFYQNRFQFKPEEFEVLNPVTASPFNPAPFKEFEGEHNHAAPSNDFWDQVIIDSFGDKLLKEKGNVFDNVKEKLQSFLNKHEDFETAINDISDLFPDLPSDDLENTLTNILFMADVIGRLSVQKENENG